MLAIKANKVDTAKYLIKKRAEVRILNDKGYTALHYAVEKDNFELMGLLLKKHAHINEESVDGTPLQYAAFRGSAILVDPSNPKWLANRSLCFTRLLRGIPALRDAEECVRLNPAHYREGSAISD